MARRNFQADEYKFRAGSGDMFERRAGMSISDRLDEERKEKIKTWVTFYRRNIHRFVQHYFGIHLYPYQRLWIYLISKSTRFLGLASRASAKSWLIGVYTVARCVLYPGTTVTINSSTKIQAGLIISEKIKALQSDYPNIAREIKELVTNMNKWEVVFHNGSSIKVIVSTDRGRGNRSNVTILEERRLIPSEIIDSIIRPFLVARIAPFMSNPEYADVIEEPQEVIISSVHYKSGEWYEEARKMLKIIANGDKDVQAIFLDYLICIQHKIKTRKQMITEKETLDPVAFLMEYGNIPYSGSSRSFFKIDFFDRKLKRAWIPRRLGPDGIGKNKYDIPRTVGELRVVAVDVASKGGSKNDNTIISAARLSPTNKGWQTDVVYIEAFSGTNVLSQALRIKQIYGEFCGFNEDGDALVLDVRNIGTFLFDALSTMTRDDERGVDYPAMTVMVHDAISEREYDELSGRCLTKEALKCIFPISASAQLNSVIASAFRSRLKSKLLRFLVDESEQEEFYIRGKNKDITNQDDPALRAHILSANANTTALINECISLEMRLTDGDKIKLEEPHGMRKDRYSSVSYMNYFVSLMDGDLLRENPDEDDLDVWMGAFGVV